MFDIAEVKIFPFFSLFWGVFLLRNLFINSIKFFNVLSVHNRLQKQFFRFKNQSTYLTKKKNKIKYTS